MKKWGQKPIVLVILPIASYLIAINFAFQLWSSLLLTLAILVFFIGLYNDMSPALLDKKLAFLFVFSLLIVIVPPFGLKTTAYGEYPYPPYVVVPDSKMEMSIAFYPKYFETERFTGFATYHNTAVIQYDLELNERRSFSFGGHPMCEIFSYAYFGEYLYVSGKYIDQNAGQDNRYSIMRVDLATDEVESFMMGDQYLQVFNLYDSLLISRWDEDLVSRVFDIYDDTMTVVETWDDLPFHAVISNVYNNGEYSVLIIGSYRYDLYHQGSFVKTLANYDSTGSDQLVTFHDERIYINSGVVSDGKYRIDAFDLLGNKDETIHYTVPTADDFILFDEHQLIVGDGYNWDDIMLWNASSVYDYDGNPLFVADDYTGLRIYEINGAFYGYDDGLYRLEERLYPVLFRFDKPQKNVVYYLCFLAVFLLIANTDEPLWKRKKPKTPEALTQDRL
jgi:hypothetical protein